jgi:hypothetical protein
MYKKKHHVNQVADLADFVTVHLNSKQTHKKSTQPTSSIHQAKDQTVGHSSAFKHKTDTSSVMTKPQPAQMKPRHLIDFAAEYQFLQSRKDAKPHQHV